MVPITTATALVVTGQIAMAVNAAAGEDVAAAAAVAVAGVKARIAKAGLRPEDPSGPHLWNQVENLPGLKTPLRRKLARRRRAMVPITMRTLDIAPLRPSTASVSLRRR